MLDPTFTFYVLLAVQAAHLLHHRLARRHISFVEVTVALVLCLPASLPIPPALLAGVHLALGAVQLAGSLWIDSLSPACHGSDHEGPLARLG